MKDKLTVTLLQQPLVWQDTTANCEAFGELARQKGRGSDLLVLPEMFNAGFSMNAAAIAEAPEGPSHRWMQQLASDLQAVVTGSYAVRIDGGVVNRLLWMRPDGSYAQYDKRHLFRMAGEHERYLAGDERLLVEIHGWRCCPMICYDLRFPAWCRNRDDYDLLLFVANWPAPRAAHWQALLKARAIENLSYVVGVNRVGEDAKGNSYQGDSVVLDAEGQPLVSAQAQAGAFTATLSAQALVQYRQRFPAHLDADPFTLL